MDNNGIGDAISAAMQLNYMATRMEIILIDKWNRASGYDLLWPCYVRIIASIVFAQQFYEWESIKWDCIQKWRKE